MIRSEDIRWISDSIGAAYSAQSLPDLSRAMTNAIDRRYRLIITACEEIGRYMESYQVHQVRMEGKLPRDYEAFLHDHPLNAPIKDGLDNRLLQLREVASMHDWAKTEHFNEVASLIGFNDLMAIVAQSSATTVCVTLYSEAKFLAYDRTILEILQPHFAAAWQRLRTMESTHADGPLTVTLFSDLRPFSLSANVRRIFKSYFASWPGGDRLPSEIISWAARSARELRRESEARPLHAYSAESAHGKLMVRFFPGEQGLIHLAMVELPALPNFLRLKKLGFTSRECELLHWIALGKRDAEIARIMGIATKTVGKHVENSLGKLSAPNRTAAIGIASSRLQGAGLL